MPWGAVVGAVVGGVLQNRGNKKAAETEAESNRLAIEEQRRQFDLTRGDMAPWLESGKGALGRLDAASTGDFSQFQESPDYQFRYDQGMRALDRSAASRGSLFSGGTDLDRIGFGQGLGSTEYGNWWNRQAGLAGVGQATAGQLGQLGSQSASNIGNLLQQGGRARASSYQQQANNWSGLAQGLGNLYTYQRQNNWGQG